MITPSFSPTATERVLPKLALDFTTASLDSRVTFTRTTDATHPATYVNSNGVITAATNNQPRFDYDPVALTCKGLLIEESRANGFLYSADLSNGNWSTSLTNTNTAITAPDGTASAYKMVPTGTGEHYKYQGNSTGTYTVSCYAKAGGYDWLNLFIQSGAAAVAYFNLSTGVVGTVSGSGTGKSASIQSIGNGWYRCIFTATVSSGAAGFLFTNADNTTSFTANGTDGMYVWGAQLEAGAFATSYIPTTSAALTRNADVATMTGTNFSSWFNAAEGAFAASATTESAAGSTQRVFSASTGSFADSISATVNTTNIQCLCFTSGAIQANFVLTGGAGNTTFKVVFGYKTNSMAAALKGGAVSTDNTATLPTVNQFGIGSEGGLAVFNGWIQNIRYWPQRLIDAEVQAFSK